MQGGHHHSWKLPGGLLLFAAECCKAVPLVPLPQHGLSADPSVLHLQDRSSNHLQQLTSQTAHFRAFQRVQMLQQASATLLDPAEAALQNQAGADSGAQPLSLLQQSALRFQHPEVRSRTFRFCSTLALCQYFGSISKSHGFVAPEHA